MGVVVVGVVIMWKGNVASGRDVDGSGGGFKAEDQHKNPHGY